MHVMIDLETYGTDPVTAPILQIAAVPFKLEELGAHRIAPGIFNSFPLPESNEWAPFNRRPSFSTARWWGTQPAELHQQMISDRMSDGFPKSDLGTCLADLLRWFGEYPEFEGVWALGTKFDLCILEAAYQQAGLQVPWRYNADRCGRTFRMLSQRLAEKDLDWESKIDWNGVPVTTDPREGIAHNAVSDCISQIKWVQKTYRGLGLV